MNRKSNIIKSKSTPKHLCLSEEIKELIRDQAKPCFDELLWCQLDIKLREHLVEILTPIKNQVQKTYNEAAQQDKKLKKLQSKVDEHQFTMSQVQERTLIAKGVHSQLECVDSQRKVFEESAEQQLKEQLEGIQDLSRRLSKLENDEIFKTKTSEKQEYGIQCLQKELLSAKEKFGKDFEQLKKELTRQQDTIKLDIKTIKEKMNMENSRINSHLTALAQQDQQMQKYKNNFIEIYDCLQDLKSSKLSTNLFENEIVQVKQEYRKLKEICEDTYNSLQQTDNYLDVYLKFEVLSDIVEMLFRTSIDHQQILNLTDVTSAKFKELEDKLQSKYQDLNKTQSDISFKSFNFKAPSQLNKVGYRIPKFEENDTDHILQFKKYNAIQTAKSKYDLSIVRQKTVSQNLSSLPRSQEEKPNIEIVDQKHQEQQTEQDLVSYNASKINFTELTLEKDSITNEIKSFGIDQEDMKREIRQSKVNQSQSRKEFRINSVMKLMDQKNELRERANTILGHSKEKSIVNYGGDESHFSFSAINKIKTMKTPTPVEHEDDDVVEAILEMFGALSVQVDDIFEKLKDQNVQIYDIKERMSKQEESVKSKLQEINKMQSEHLAQVQFLRDEDQKRRIKDKSNIDLQIKRLQEELKTAQKGVCQEESQITLLLEAVKNLKQCCQISASILYQDEQDKKSVQLLGQKNETKRDNFYETQSSSPFSLDKNCLSCSTNQNSIINLFKVACLKYQPTKVLYESKFYDRRTLLDIYTSLLNQANSSSLIKSTEFSDTCSQSIHHFSVYNPPHIIVPSEHKKKAAQLSKSKSPDSHTQELKKSQSRNLQNTLTSSQFFNSYLNQAPKSTKNQGINQSQNLKKKDLKCSTNDLSNKSMIQNNQTTIQFNIFEKGQPKFVKYYMPNRTKRDLRYETHTPSPFNKNNLNPDLNIPFKNETIILAENQQQQVKNRELGGGVEKHRNRRQVVLRDENGDKCKTPRF